MEHANSLVGTARVGSRTRKCQRERRSSEQRGRNEEADEEADERAAVVGGRGERGQRNNRNRRRRRATKSHAYRASEGP